MIRQSRSEFNDLNGSRLLCSTHDKTSTKRKCRMMPFPKVCRQCGQVGWIAVCDTNDCTLEPHNGHIVVSLGEALYGNSSDLVVDFR